MDLQAAFRARLLTNTTFAGLVTKVAWGGVPEKTSLPYIRLTKSSAGREWTHEGPNPLVNPRVQIDVFAASERDLGPIAAALQDEMERLTPVDAGGWTFLPPGVIELDEWPGVDDMNGGGQAYRVIHDYRFYAQPTGA
jgi:hypothetical protein